MAWAVPAVAAGLLAGMTLVSIDARADIDPSAYETKAVIRSEKERTRLRYEIEREAQIEAERARRAEEEEQRRLDEERARLEARPYPVKLLERRCTLCHTANNYTQNGHTWLGWQAVALRMQYLNDCPLEPGERAVIATHLAQQYPAPAVMATLEWCALPTALLVPLGGALGYRAWRRRRAIGARR